MLKDLSLKTIAKDTVLTSDDYGAVHILRKHIFGSLSTLGGIISAW